MLHALLFLQAAAATPAACPANSPLVHMIHAKPTASLPLDQPVELTATTGTDPKRPGKAASAPFVIATAGTYTVALGSAGWLDVMPAGGKPLASVGHGHSPCAGVRKLVAFNLTPGAYTFTAAGLQGDTVRVALLSGDQTPKKPA